MKPVHRRCRTILALAMPGMPLQPPHPARGGAGLPVALGTAGDLPNGHLAGALPVLRFSKCHVNYPDNLKHGRE